MVLDHSTALERAVAKSADRGVVPPAFPATSKDRSSGADTDRKASRNGDCHAWPLISHPPICQSRSSRPGHCQHPSPPQFYPSTPPTTPYLHGALRISLTTPPRTSPRDLYPRGPLLSFFFLATSPPSPVPWHHALRRHSGHLTVSTQATGSTSLCLLLGGPTLLKIWPPGLYVTLALDPY